MGKPLIQQRRGKGSIFRVPKHSLKGKAQLCNLKATEGKIVSLLTSKIHSAPLMKVKFGKDEQLMIAPEGVKVGDVIKQSTEVKPGHIMQLKDIPEGTLIYNIEQTYGDGGKLVRASGNFARVAQKTGKEVRVVLPSKKIKLISPACRATIGVVAGGGRVEKPFMKAGNKYKAMKAKHKKYPLVCGISMNAVAHPFGSKSSHIKGRPLHTSRHAPPGRKVGKLSPRRTGMKR